MAFFYTDSGSFNILEVTGSTILSGSLIVSGATNFGPTGLTGSLFGTASNATSASYALTASYATNAVSTPAFPFSGSAVITGSLFVSQSISNTPAIQVTGSVQFLTGSSRIYTSLDSPTNGRITLEGGTSDVYMRAGGSGASIGSNTDNLDIFSAGVRRVFINSNGIIPSANSTRDLGADGFYWRDLFVDRIIAAGSITSSIVSASTAITASNVQLKGLTDTTSANKVLVLDTTTNKIFTTASVGGGGSSTPAFPYDGRTTPAIISGSLLISASITTPALQTTGSLQFLSSSVTINSGSIKIHTGSFSVYDASGNNLLIRGSTISTDTGTAVPVVIRYAPGDNGVSFDVNIEVKPENDNLGSLGIATRRWSRAAIVQVSASIVSASSYTSSLNNQVGYFGTSSFAVSSSQAISASFARTAISASYFSGSATFPDGLTVASLTASVAQLTGLTDTTAANKVLVLNTTTNQLFTTASVGTGGGGSGTGFPFSGSAIITGSMIVSASGIQVIGNGITGSISSGSFFNIIELSMAVSGTIPANLAANTITLDLNQSNYYTVSASAPGTVTWVVSNAPPTGRVQTFVIEYTNGGVKTNTWFTNTRWPAGVAPSLTSASANPDILSFTTDDSGANWRGLLLQRGSA